ncbi:hypothetical protein DFH06DRAFT_1132306 [Mycena polygramma]|nr:hypothetical protein DFH06DRAFT_1132306 [Mycena polygramma]
MVVVKEGGSRDVRGDGTSRLRCSAGAEGRGVEISWPWDNHGMLNMYALCGTIQYHGGPGTFTTLQARRCWKTRRACPLFSTSEAEKEWDDSNIEMSSERVEREFARPLLVREPGFWFISERSASATATVPKIFPVASSVVRRVPALCTHHLHRRGSELGPASLVDGAHRAQRGEGFFLVNAPATDRTVWIGVPTVTVITVYGYGFTVTVAVPQSRPPVTTL